MAYLGQIVLLAMGVTITIISFGSAVAGVVSGRLKAEPSQPWIVFRKQPVKFAALVLPRLGLASLFTVASVRVAAGLLR